VAMAAPGGLREGVREILRVAPPAHQPEFEALEFGAALCICELDDDSAAELLIGFDVAQLKQCRGDVY
jgi:hypothetical protein